MNARVETGMEVSLSRLRARGMTCYLRCVIEHSCGADRRLTPVPLWRTRDRTRTRRTGGRDQEVVGNGLRQRAILACRRPPTVATGRGATTDPVDDEPNIYEELGLADWPPELDREDALDAIVSFYQVVDRMDDVDYAITSDFDLACDHLPARRAGRPGR